MTKEGSPQEIVLEASRKADLPKLEDLHERHPGLTPHLAGALAEAARVCLARHHSPPSTDLRVSHANENCLRAVAWDAPDERIKRAWANQIDTTESGAYSIALASVEAELGWVTIARADILTGADYYVCAPGQTDLETAHRLEVSGSDEGTETMLALRVSQKVKQAQEGRSDRPALVGIVGFLQRRVAIEAVSDEQGE